MRNASMLLAALVAATLSWTDASRAADATCNGGVRMSSGQCSVPALSRLGALGALVANQRKISRTSMIVPPGADTSTGGPPASFGFYESRFGTMSTGAGPVSP